MIGVCIVTYNQEQYIAQAIDSVLMQVDCGHRVVAYIGNDCSTDKTGEICRQYAKNYPEHVVFVDNEQNLGLVGNTMNLLDIMRKDGCEYIAMLDGDDYWCDDHKLYKQLNYMHDHPEYGLVHTCIDLLYPHKYIADKRESVQEGDVSAIISNYSIGNCSVVFKTELLNLIDFEEFQQQGFMSVDYIMYLIFSCHTQFGFLSDHTAVWRRGHDSVSNTNDMEKQIRYVHNSLAMWKYAAKLYPERWTADEKDLEDYFHFRAFAIAFKYGDRKRALQEANLMGEGYRKKQKLKILVTHSAILSALWRRYKRI